MKNHITKRVASTVVESVICDGCRVEVNEIFADENWHEFNRHHSDWGNDSIESYEYFDVCSVDCFIKVVKVELDCDSDTIEIDGKNRAFMESLIKRLE